MRSPGRTGRPSSPRRRSRICCCTRQGCETSGSARGDTSCPSSRTPLARAFEPVGPFQWEPIALVVVGPIELLVAPLNVLLGIGLATLVGLNLAVSVVAWRGPAACRIAPRSGRGRGAPGVALGSRLLWPDDTASRRCPGQCRRPGGVPVALARGRAVAPGHLAVGGNEGGPGGCLSPACYSMSASVPNSSTGTTE